MKHAGVRKREKKAGLVPLKTTGSPSAGLVGLLNEVPRYHRWCTPSVLLNVPMVSDVCENDVSVSWDKPGSPVSVTGAFEEAVCRAAKIFGADRCLFSVAGSTFSNRVVVQMLCREEKRPKILIPYNTHISVYNAAEVFGARIAYIRSEFDPEYECFVPVSGEDVLEALERNPDTKAVIITFPTYGGFSGNLSEIAKVVREFDDGIKLIVDEAWGVHLNFHERLPRLAIRTGADIAVESVHKMGGGLQGTGVLMWNEDRVDSDLLLDCYRSQISTSPPYHLFANIDSVLTYLKRRGRREVGRLIRLSERFRRLLSDELEGVKVLDGEFRERWRHRLSGWDPLKTTVVLENFRVSGYEVARELQENYIVEEKSGLNTVTFITTFQLRPEAVEDTVDVMKRILAKKPTCRSKDLLSPPFNLKNSVREPADVYREPARMFTMVPLEKTVGRICGESVTPYPPGCPILVRGQMITWGVIKYLINVRDSGGHIISWDGKLSKIRVLNKT